MVGIDLVAGVLGRVPPPAEPAPLRARTQQLRHRRAGLGVVARLLGEGGESVGMPCPQKDWSLERLMRR